MAYFLPIPTTREDGKVVYRSPTKQEKEIISSGGASASSQFQSGIPEKVVIGGVEKTTAQVSEDIGKAQAQGDISPKSAMQLYMNIVGKRGETYYKGDWSSGLARSQQDKPEVFEYEIMDHGGAATQALAMRQRIIDARNIATRLERPQNPQETIRMPPIQVPSFNVEKVNNYIENIPNQEKYPSKIIVPNRVPSPSETITDTSKFREVSPSKYAEYLKETGRLKDVKYLSGGISTGNVVKDIITPTLGRLFPLNRVIEISGYTTKGKSKGLFADSLWGTKESVLKHEILHLENPSASESQILKMSAERSGFVIQRDIDKMAKYADKQPEYKQFVLPDYKPTYEKRVSLEKVFPFNPFAREINVGVRNVQDVAQESLYYGTDTRGVSSNIALGTVGLANKETAVMAGLVLGAEILSPVAGFAVGAYYAPKLGYEMAKGIKQSGIGGVAGSVPSFTLFAAASKGGSLFRDVIKENTLKYDYKTGKLTRIKDVTGIVEPRFPMYDWQTGNRQRTQPLDLSKGVYEVTTTETIGLSDLKSASTTILTKLTKGFTSDIISSVMNVLTPIFGAKSVIAQPASMFMVLADVGKRRPSKATIRRANVERNVQVFQGTNKIVSKFITPYEVGIKIRGKELKNIGVKERVISKSFLGDMRITDKGIAPNRGGLTTIYKQGKEISFVEGGKQRTSIGKAQYTQRGAENRQQRSEIVKFISGESQGKPGQYLIMRRSLSMKTIGQNIGEKEPIKSFKFEKGNSNIVIVEPRTKPQPYIEKPQPKQVGGFRRGSASSSLQRLYYRTYGTQYTPSTEQGIINPYEKKTQGFVFVGEPYTTDFVMPPQAIKQPLNAGLMVINTAPNVVSKISRASSRINVFKYQQGKIAQQTSQSYGDSSVSADSRVVGLNTNNLLSNIESEVFSQKPVISQNLGLNAFISSRQNINNIQDISSKQSLALDVSPISIVDLSQIQDLSQEQQQIQDSIFKIQFKPPVDNVPRQTTKIDLQENQFIKKRTEEKPNERPRPKPPEIKFPKEEPKQPIPIIEEDRPNKSKKKSKNKVKFGKGYNIFIKNKLLKLGKKRYKNLGFARVNKQPLSLEAAKGLGAILTSQSARRSFRIMEAFNNTPSSDAALEQAWQRLAYRYRTSKNPNEFVQKTAFAISSPQEKAEITYKGLLQKKLGTMQNRLKLKALMTQTRIKPSKSPFSSNSLKISLKGGSKTKWL